MRQLTVQIPDNKYDLFLELLRSVDYVAIEGDSVTEEQKNTVRKRVKQSEADPSRLLDWEQVKHQIKF